MTTHNLEDYHKVLHPVKMTMFVKIKFEDDVKNPPGEEYDSQKDYSQKYSVDDDVQQWLNENVTGKVLTSVGVLYFEVVEDAVAFKLRWS